MKGAKGIHMVTFILLVIGGLNWLLVGLLGRDVGDLFLGGMDTVISKIIYILVGVSAIYEVVMHKKNCKHCGESKPTASSMGSM